MSSRDDVYIVLLEETSRYYARPTPARPMLEEVDNPPFADDREEREHQAWAWDRLLQYRF